MFKYGGYGQFKHNWTQIKALRRSWQDSEEIICMVPWRVCCQQDMRLIQEGKGGVYKNV